MSQVESARVSQRGCHWMHTCADLHAFEPTYRVSSCFGTELLQPGDSCPTADPIQLVLVLVLELVLVPVLFSLWFSEDVMYMDMDSRQTRNRNRIEWIAWCAT